MITVNKENNIKEINTVYNNALSTIKMYAERGQEYYTINFNLPNSEDGWTVMGKLEREEHIVIANRGYKSTQSPTGSYDFSVTCYLKS